MQTMALPKSPGDQASDKRSTVVVGDPETSNYRSSPLLTSDIMLLNILRTIMFLVRRESKTDLILYFGVIWNDSYFNTFDI